jgi:hypothetical protein
MPSSTSEPRLVGITLLITGFCSLFLMMHHPTSFHAQTLTAVVHGGMIAAILLAQMGILYLATKLDMTRPAALAMATLFSVGSLFNVAAGLMNGFIVPEWLQHIGTEGTHEVRDFAWAINQNCARLGILTHGAAMLLTALPLLNRPKTPLNFSVLLTSLLAGILSPAVLLIHHGQLNVHTALLCYGLESVWFFAIGLLLIWYQNEQTEAT